MVMLASSRGLCLPKAGWRLQKRCVQSWQDLFACTASASNDWGTGNPSKAERSKVEPSLQFAALQRLPQGTTALSRKLKRALSQGPDLEDRPVRELELDWGDTTWEEETVTEVPRKKTPAEVRCFDTAKVQVKSGDGGNGCVAFHREKFVSKGGPSGGSGGRGGHVWAIADQNLNSLLSFRRKVHFRAGKGGNGKGSNLTGAQGEDTFVSVPPGTVIRVKDVRNVPPLAELFRHGDRALLAVGGKGGRGNLAFKTARNNAPTIAENGAPGEEQWLELELKLMADVGIIGIPNAGKSTFLSSISAAKPKIANYPFTTLTPNLGVCEYDYQTTVFADVPGLLEGASKGIGLGHEFLRHCMRCRVLVHVVDGTSPDPIGDYEAIQLELQLFSPELASKPQIVCYNKTDVPEAAEKWGTINPQLLSKGVAEEHVFSMSAVAGANTDSVVRAVREVLRDLPEEADVETNAMNLQKPLRSSSTAQIEDYTISVQRDITPHLYRIEGEAIELFTSMTNWTYYEAYRRFQRVLDRSGISDALRERGIREGDDVQIGEKVFAWSDENSERQLYQSFKEAQKIEGRSPKGVARWPHST